MGASGRYLHSVDLCSLGGGAFVGAGEVGSLICVLRPHDEKKLLGVTLQLLSLGNTAKDYGVSSTR